MTIKFKHLLKENYYKTLSTMTLAAGFSFCSYIGVYAKNIVFNEDISSVNLKLCLVFLGLGIIMLGLSIYFSFRIDWVKGVAKK